MRDCRNNAGQILHRSCFCAVAVSLCLTGCAAKSIAPQPPPINRIANAPNAKAWGPNVSIDRLDRELEELRAMAELGDDQIVARRFEPLLPRFLLRAEADDFIRMLRDPSPLIRAMALFCLVYEPANSDVRLATALRRTATDETALPNDLMWIDPPLTNPNGPITIAQVTEFVRSRNARDRLPPLPESLPADKSAEDCERFLHLCHEAVDASAIEDRSAATFPSTTSQPIELDRSNGDSPAWVAATRALSLHPRRAVLDRMLRDASPIIRAAAIAAIARSRQPDAIDVLSISLQDDSRVWLAADAKQQPVRFASTVGDIAARILIDPSFLPVQSDEPFDLLGDDARRSLLLRMLADDQFISRQTLLRRLFAAEMKRSDNPIDALLAFVSKRDAVTIKALGRAAFDNGLSDDAIAAVRTFLIACVDDATLDSSTRFAAASALTRDDSPAAHSALESIAAEIDALSPDRKLGQRFAAEASLRDQLQSMFTDTPSTTVASATTATVGIATHPMIIDHLRRRELNRIVESDVFAAAVSEALDRISERLDVFAAPWDTYSNVGWELDALLQVGGKPLAKALTESRTVRLLAAAKAAETSTKGLSSATTRP